MERDLDTRNIQDLTIDTVRFETSSSGALKYSTIDTARGCLFSICIHV